jgi:glycosyltransferase involved in cell wall biosynthesis
MLSIITPHYNSPETLKILLDSIPADSGIEIIVVDDKSTKGIDEYKAMTQAPAYARVTFLSNTSDAKGAGVCRNIGIDHAKGDWLLFADADDFFLSGFYDIVEKYLDKDYDIVFFAPTSVDISTGETSFRHEEFARLIENYNNTRSRADELKLRYRYEVPWSKLISASFVKENGIRFDETIVSNDTMFSVKAGHCMANFYAAEEAIYCATASSGSLTTTVSEYIYLTRLGVFVRYYTFLKEALLKQDFLLLNLSGIGRLAMGFIEKQKLGTILKAAMILRKNRVRLLRPEYLNLSVLLGRIREIFVSYKRARQYNIKQEK